MPGKVMTKILNRLGNQALYYLDSLSFWNGILFIIFVTVVLFALLHFWGQLKHRTADPKHAARRRNKATRVKS
jgi:hypothetical protein